MSNVLGQKNEDACVSIPAIFPTDEGQFTLEYKESLVSSMMNVKWWSEAWRQDLFDKTERLSVALPGRFEKHEHAQKPAGPTILTCQDVGS